MPQETTKVIRVNSLFRNQRIGLPMGTQFLADLIHKNSFRELENTIINKAVRNVATLTVGTKEVPYLSLNKNVRKKVTNGVYQTLKNSTTSGGTPMVVVPEWASLEFANITASLSTTKSGGRKSIPNIEASASFVVSISSNPLVGFFKSIAISFSSSPKFS